MSFENVHKIVKYEEKVNSVINKLMTELMKNLFNKDLTYGERRNFFIQHSMENIAVFNAMYNLQLKGKENVEKVDHLIKYSEEVVQKQQNNEEELKKLLSRKHFTQKQIDDLLEKIYIR